MALFFNKVGAAARRGISGGSGGRSAAMVNAIRCISSKLYVGGLSKATDDHLLKEAFSRFGDVAEARIIMDFYTGKSKRGGYVTFVDDRSATSAIAAMDGRKLQGVRIVVSFAHDVDHDGYYCTLI